MKVCTKCDQEYPETNFFARDKKSGRLHAQCKACYQQHRQTYQAKHYAQYKKAYLLRAQKRREMLRNDFRRNMITYLEKKRCRDCGESDMRVLEFDHIDPAEKTFTISQAVRLGYSWQQTLDEIKKCQIRCANCHKKRTAEQFGWYKT